MDIQIGNPNYAYLIVFAVFAILLAVGSAVARRRAAGKFVSAELRKSVMPDTSPVRRFLSALLIACSIALLAIALMDIRWGKTTREVPQRGIEVMFALDVSRSMLAEDASPNRLQRAKQQIKDMVDEMAGDRVGLVVFAGEARQVVPLTSHYDDFKQILDTVGPHSISRGGSRLGDALEAASNGFMGKTNDHKTIVLFTDGEDQESRPVELARRLNQENGTRVFTVGLGDFEQGSRIPDSDSRRNEFVEHDGQQVWSKLNGQVLQSIATETDGAYIPAGTKRVNMADVYHGYIAGIEQTEFETARIDAYVPRFQWFAGAALALLILEVWITNGAGNRATQLNAKNRAVQADRAAWQTSAPSSSGRAALQGNYRNAKVGAASIFFLLVAALPVSAQSQSAIPGQINAANQLLRDQKIEEALEAFNRIDDSHGEHRDQLNYNLGVAHYRNGDFPAAQTLFSQAANSRDSEIAASSRYNLGNCHYSQALSKVEEDYKSAIDELQNAIANYRSSLRLNRNNADARANIELAGELLRQLNNRKEDQEQEKNQQDDQESNQNQDQKGETGQNSDQQSKEQTEGANQESDEKQSEQAEQNESQGSENDSQSEQGEKESDQDAKQDSGDNGQQSSESDSQSSEQQQSDSKGDSQDQTSQPNQAGQDPGNERASQSGSQSESESADQDDSTASGKDSGSQEPPTGDLTSANEDPNSQPEGQSASMINQDGKAGVMTREEALKLLQSVRDRDMIRRLQQQQRERSRRVPVEKDW